MNIWQSYNQESGSLCAPATTLLKDEYTIDILSMARNSCRVCFSVLCAQTRIWNKVLK